MFIISRRVILISKYNLLYYLWIYCCFSQTRLKRPDYKYDLKGGLTHIIDLSKFTFTLILIYLSKNISIWQKYTFMNNLKISHLHLLFSRFLTLSLSFFPIFLSFRSLREAAKSNFFSGPPLRRSFLSEFLFQASKKFFRPSITPS